MKLNCISLCLCILIASAFGQASNLDTAVEDSAYAANKAAELARKQNKTPEDANREVKYFDRAEGGITAILKAQASADLKKELGKLDSELKALKDADSYSTNTATAANDVEETAKKLMKYAEDGGAQRPSN